MAAIGWNTVRLLVSWSRIEPRPGRYDCAYLKRVAATVRASRPPAGSTPSSTCTRTPGARRSPRVPGEACPAGSDLPALGWDGAPAWATLDGGAARCDRRSARGSARRCWPPGRRSSPTRPGPGGVGVQTRYVRDAAAAWPASFARSTAVAGFDLMNEPNAFGPRPGGGPVALLRTARSPPCAPASGAGKGRRHLVLFEPSALWSATGSGAAARLPARPRRRLRAAHIHGRLQRWARSDPRRVRHRPHRGPRLRRRPRAVAGSGARTPTGPGSAATATSCATRRSRTGSASSATLWTWRESCGDPHKVGDLARRARPRGVGRVRGGLPDATCPHVRTRARAPS